MEMPVDILTYRFGKLVDYGVNISDPAAVAVDIDEELQRKFYFIPKEEVDEVHIEENTTHLHVDFGAGSGPETIRAARNDNPAWLYNSAVHALAMMEHLQKIQAEDAKIPEPGVYLMTGSTTPLTVIITADRRVIVNQFGTADMKDQTALILKADHYTFQRIDLVTGTFTNQ